jgi:hypothetical protein
MNSSENLEFLNVKRIKFVYSVSRPTDNDTFIYFARRTSLASSFKT